MSDSTPEKALVDPTRIAPIAFMVETEENVGATLVRMIDKDGREVYVGLDDNTRRVLSSMLGQDRAVPTMPEPITPETLAEIRRHDETDLRAAEKPDGALDETAWERHVLLAEVDRLTARVAELTALLNDPDRLTEHARDLRLIYAEVDAMDEADRLAAGGEL